MRRRVRKCKRFYRYKFTAIAAVAGLGSLPLAQRSSADEATWAGWYGTLPLLARYRLAAIAGGGQAQVSPGQTGAAAPQPPPAAGEPHIGSIIVQGNHTLNAAFIIAASGHKVGDPCNDQTLSEMQTNIFKTGYFGMHSADQEEAVRVSAQENNPPNGLCTVVIQVDENDTVHFVNITGSGPIKPEVIRPLIHIDQTHGTVYSEPQFDRDISDIQALYQSKGYILGVSEDSGPDPKNPGVLNLVLIVDRVADIKINGLHKTKRTVIIRELQTKLNDYFNQFTLDHDRVRLLNLGLFEDVDPAENLLGPGRIGVTINVVEKRTGTVNVGAGYSSRSQLIGFAEIAETNFRGMDETISLRWSTGGIINKNSVELAFTEPWLDKRQTSLNVELYDRIIYRFENSIQNSIPSPINPGATNDQYNEQRVGSTITVSRPFHNNTYRAAVSLRGEAVHTDAIDLSPVNAQIVQDGPTYSIAGSLIHNTRDLDIDPVSGGLQQAALEVGHADLTPAIKDAIGGLFGSVTWTKASLDIRQYYSLQGPRLRNKPDADKRSLALRLLVGATVGGVPFFEQFFVGGAETLRGYREERFWGTNMMLGSVEFRQPLARRLKGVLFFDIGDAWGGAYNNANIAGFQQGGFKLYPGVGFGIRVATPLGPVRLDFGFGTEGGRTHFSIGNVF